MPYLHSSPRRSKITLYYFAYGSNLHPLRLTARVPSARVIGRCRLDGYGFSLKHPSLDGSGKCNIFPADMDNTQVVGVLYEIQNPMQKRILDEIEGEQFGWGAIEVDVRNQNVTRQAFTYTACANPPEQSAPPYHWYHEIVLLGALFHGLPDVFVEQIVKTKSQPDLDYSRNKMNQALVARLRGTI